jgi:hypothetical protein
MVSLLDMRQKSIAKLAAGMRPCVALFRVVVQYCGKVKIILMIPVIFPLVPAEKTHYLSTFIKVQHYIDNSLQRFFNYRYPPATSHHSPPTSQSTAQPKAKGHMVSISHQPSAAPTTS